MKQNVPLFIEVTANGFLVTAAAKRYSDESTVPSALVFETKAGLLKYLDEHFLATKKPTVETK